MFKSARLFAALLALAGTFAVPDTAHAMGRLCGIAERVLSNMDNVTSPYYGLWVIYWMENCEG